MARKNSVGRLCKDYVKHGVKIVGYSVCIYGYLLLRHNVPKKRK